MGINKKKSFTLIEVVVSVSVIALILPSVFAIFFSIMRQQIILIAYKDMLIQGDNVQNTLRSMIKERAARVTDLTYTTDVCPLLTLPTPTLSASLYLLDRDGNQIRLSQEIVSPMRIASSSATKTYYLTSSSVLVTNLGFTCYRSNSYTQPYVQVFYTLQKSAVYKDASLPYTFSARIFGE